MQRILTAVCRHGGRPLKVGGCVRDKFLGKQPKDIDIEVYGLDTSTLSDILSEFGRVEAVGASFGVLKLTTPDGQDFDFSLPRRENKVGRGHKGFFVEPDPTMTPREAAARRDFTMNALAEDPFTGEVLDFFGGREDLSCRILRATSDKFAEDPLRVLRGFQFAGRFGMGVEKNTAHLCRSLLPEYDSLAVERVWGEWHKWATKSTIPSKGLKFLRETGWVDLYPQIRRLIGCPQDLEWHPEGDVWQHTCHTVDMATAIADREGLDTRDRAVLVLAALLHDSGKPDTTVADVANSRLRSPGHAEAGAAQAEGFLRQIGAPRDITERVVKLVHEHLAHLNCTTHRAARRLALRLSPVSIRDLVLLIEADHSARPPLPRSNPAFSLLSLAEEAGVDQKEVAPLIMGRHLIRNLGWAPGPEFGKVLRAAYEAQLDGVFQSLEEGLKWIVEFC